MCDFIICSNETKFIEIFSKRGLIIDFGGGWILPKLVGFQNTNRLALLAESVNSEKLLELGLVYKSVDRTELDSAVKTLIEDLNSVSYNSICQIKKLIRIGMEIPMNDFLDLEHDLQLETFEHPDGLEGAMSFLEKRKPDFK
jgi:2-(1,2-epoxy-1,2-dihydrophenyl)acetyl-CoA isomerase